MRVDEAFPSKYLKAGDLNGTPVTVTIKNYELTEIKDRTGKSQTKPELHFRGTEKTMVLNKTNAHKISQILGSPEMDDWIGKKIVLYPTTTEFAGEEVEAIRVRAAGVVNAPKPVVSENPAEGMDDEIPF